MLHTLSKFIFASMFSVLSACSSIESNQPSEKSTTFHFGYQQDSVLAHYFEAYGKDPKTITGFYPLNQGHDALLARTSLIESAQKSLDLQYYIYRGDETSQLITWRLYEAAKRGVRIRLLLDDMQKRNDNVMAALNAHPNIEIRLFNPHQYRSARIFALTSDFERLNRRMHNKSLIADSVSAIVGGRNIGNEYFSFESEVEFGDFDLLLYGEAVQQTADQFDLYWNSVHAVPMEWISPESQSVSDAAIQKQVTKLNLQEKFSSGRYDFTALDMYQDLKQGKLNLYWGDGQVWFDLPDKVTTHDSQLVGNLTELLKSVEHSFVLISPYFIPTEAGTKALTNAAKRGVDITIVTNSLASNDVFAVHGWYAKYREDLLESGIKLWEVKSSAKLKSKWSLTGSSRASLHAKAMTIDDKTLFVGSMNWDPRSAALNTEMAVVIEQPEYVQAFLAKLPSQLKDNAYRLTLRDGDIVWTNTKTGEEYDSEPEAGVFRRLGAWFSGILPIEDQL
ncbi:TPA: phospholipase D family protein [Vibrio parahaemolyticus]|uniref:phospholipase D family protein n=1 Tax=Vibrio parahaemolyticus TaxID=670 RepID=UPI0003F7D1D2|nr:phospholipase D family protein [Vibrio parahaemolyticus]EGQ8106372.1 phospholipase D family protein [Vibrio parahaemolyticus]EGQ9887052.1 phospholipase D family protein [Vibrio parahaemolyticus]EGR1500603.1 phospholipase D family protein [Vibrio parahaemolyticus]EGR2701716.1 phospholipase D family protein [Vibrio parahaemolyticus]EGR3396864.1 phospholipase D family protein [Vibrio parahaemolyticus]